jgi:hypothetical protein
MTSRYFVLFRRSILCLVALALCAAFNQLIVEPRALAASCTAAEKLELLRAGASPEEIKKLCEDESSRPDQRVTPPQDIPPSPTRELTPQVGPIPDIQVQQRAWQAPPPVATTCYTNWGGCPMVQPVPPGSICYCYTAFGVLPGQAQ